jgi:hypothetical protein
MSVLQGHNPVLYEKFRQEFGVNTKSDRHPDGCCCKGNQQLRLAELYEHASDLSGQGGNYGLTVI